MLLEFGDEYNVPFKGLISKRFASRCPWMKRFASMSRFVCVGIKTARLVDRDPRKSMIDLLAPLNA